MPDSLWVGILPGTSGLLCEKAEQFFRVLEGKTAGHKEADTSSGKSERSHWKAEGGAWHQSFSYQPPRWMSLTNENKERAGAWERGPCV